MVSFIVSMFWYPSDSTGSKSARYTTGDSVTGGSVISSVVNFIK